MNKQFLKRLGDLRVRWVRHPVDGVEGRALRVLIYARFSTKEQRRRTIKAQIEHCKKFLKKLTGLRVEIQIITDEGISGELRDRPGIDEVWEGVGRGKWDLVLTVEASRFYRDDVWCVDLVRLAVDRGARVICIGDFVDTADPDWEDRLKDAARFAALSNRHCSMRVKRGHEELWDAGAAVGLLKPGFYRVPSVPAKAGERAKGPFYDQVDLKWQPVIKEAYERIAAGESPRLVGLWLTQQGLPKVANSKSPVWSDDNVKALIRRTVYRGAESYRDSIATKELTTGKHSPKENAPEEVLYRFMPHLRMVEDWLWYAANKAIDDRAPKTNARKGRDNPQYRIPRASRGPLAGVYLCTCGAKMHGGVRSSGGYRCSQSGKSCWIKMTVTRTDAHQRIGQTVSEVLQGLDQEIDIVLQTARGLLDDGGRRAAAKEKLTRRENKLHRSLRRLSNVVADEKNPPQSILEEIKRRQRRLARTKAKLDGLQMEVTACAVPTRSELEERLEHLRDGLSRMDRTVRDELKLLVREITSAPFQQFGSDKVVPWARFAIGLWGLLPARTRAALLNVVGGDASSHFASIPQLIMLFEPSTGPKYCLEALRLYEQNIGLTKIGVRLGISKRQANIAVQYGRQLRTAGRTDAFVELTAPPPQASRWRAPGTGKSRSKKVPPQDPRQAG